MYKIYKDGQCVCTINYDLRREQIENIADLFGKNVTVLFNDEYVFYNNPKFGEGISPSLLKLQKTINKKLKFFYEK